MTNFIKNWSNGYDFANNWGLMTFYDNYMYVPCNNNIIKTNLNGSVINPEWWTGINGESLQSIVIDNGYLFVSDYNTGNISKISLSNPTNYTGDWMNVEYPHGLAIYNGYMYICRFNASCISRVKLSDTSDFLNNWVTCQTEPVDLVINNANLYISSYNSGVTYTNLIGTPVNKPFIASLIVSPSFGIAIYEGNVYVSHGTINGKIGRFNIDNPGNNPDLNWLTGLDNPSGLTVYNDNMYIAELGGNISKIQLKELSCLLKGTKVRTIEGYKNIENIKVGDYVISDKRVPKKVIKIHNWNIKWKKNILERNRIYIIENYKTKTYLSAYHKFMKDNKMVAACNGKLRVARKEEICDKNDEYKLYHIQIEDHKDHHLLVNGDNIVESWDGIFY